MSKLNQKNSKDQDKIGESGVPSAACGSKSGDVMGAIDRPWEGRLRGASGKKMGRVPLSARMEDGSLTCTLVSDFEAFAMVWDPKKAPAIILKAVKREASGCSRATAEEAERLLLLDFPARRGALIALSGSLWCLPERDLLASSVTQQAWVNAWSAGARRVDGLGVETCAPPDSWRFDAVHPRARADCAQALSWASGAEGFLSPGALREWVQAIAARGEGYTGSGRSTLTEAAERYGVDVERAEIEATSLAATSVSRSAPRL